jgi:DNA-binding IclR family transcriptional regulator
MIRSGTGSSQDEEEGVSLNTVKKIGPVLDLFTPEQPEWRMTDIARALNTPKSSAHALVSTLAEIGLLSVGPSGRYRLGLGLLSLSERVRASLDILQYATPPMQELARKTRETVLLATLDRHEVVYIDRVEGTHPAVRLAGVRPGSRVPTHCTAVGKVLLAFRDTTEVRKLMAASTFRKFTPRTITDMDTFEKELVRVRARGVAFDREEVVPGVACMAAPISDRYGAVIAGMSMSLPAYRMPQAGSPAAESLVEALVEAAHTVSARVSNAEADVSEPDWIASVA